MKYMVPYPRCRRYAIVLSDSDLFHTEKPLGGVDCSMGTTHCCCVLITPATDRRIIGIMGDIKKVIFYILTNSTQKCRSEAFILSPLGTLSWISTTTNKWPARHHARCTPSNNTEQDPEVVGGGTRNLSHTHTTLYHTREPKSEKAKHKAKQPRAHRTYQSNSEPSKPIIDFIHHGYDCWIQVPWTCWYKASSYAFGRKRIDHVE